LFSTQRQLADDLANPAHLLLDDEWDVEPGDDRDIRDPEAILARMPGLLLAAGPGWMKLDPHGHQIWIHPSRSSKALSRQSRPPPLRRSSRSPRPAPPGFVVWADRRHPEVHPPVCAPGKSGVLPTDLPSARSARPPSAWTARPNSPTSVVQAGYPTSAANLR
jgi:hypothetical protein